MSYQALYRKFRPDSFEQVCGQDAIVTTLKNQLKAGRIGHAYLFCGTRGTGKTTVAKILAKAVNCEHPTENGPCGQCSMCREMAGGNSMNVIEIDAASNNGVDNIRDIREEVAYRPPRGRYKVYIIDEVHMLSVSAFNALLKTLEEPPEYIIFILATTEAQKIPATILSRCQRYDFRRISLDVITDRLTELLQKEGVEAEPRAVRYIARMGDGSMRDALSLLDRCIGFYLGQKLTYDNVLDVLGAVDTEVFGELLEKIIRSDVTGCIGILEKLVNGGKEFSQFAADFAWFLRNLLLLKTSEHPEEVIDASSENLEMMKRISGEVEVETLLRYIRVLSELGSTLRQSSQKRVMTEVALIRLCRPAMETDQESVLDRIRVIERRLDEAPVQAAVHNRQPAAEPKEKAQEPDRTLPKAHAPEELARIVSQWAAIVGRTENTLKVLLKEATPSFREDDSEHALIVVIPQSPTARLHQENPESIRQLRQAISEVTGLDAAVHIVQEKEAPRGTFPVTQNDIDRLIRENIHMEIETED